VDFADATTFTTELGEPVPTVTSEQMRTLDRTAEEHGYGVSQMVEHAGRRLADLVHALYRAPTSPLQAPRVLVLAGSGGNGAGVLAAARHLAAAAARVKVVGTWSTGSSTRPVMQAQLALLNDTSVQVVDASGMLPAGADVVLDGLLGYGFSGPLRGRHRGLIEEHQAMYPPGQALVISLDVPSGMDPDQGPGEMPMIRPVVTMTVAAPKRGLLDPAAGDIWLADIGIPREFYRSGGVEPPPSCLAQTGLIRLIRPIAG